MSGIIRQVGKVVGRVGMHHVMQKKLRGGGFKEKRATCREMFELGSRRC